MKAAADRFIFVTLSGFDVLMIAPPPPRLNPAPTTLPEGSTGTDMRNDEFEFNVSFKPLRLSMMPSIRSKGKTVLEFNDELLSERSLKYSLSSGARMLEFTVVLFNVPTTEAYTTKSRYSTSKPKVHSLLPVAPLLRDSLLSMLYCYRRWTFPVLA